MFPDVVVIHHIQETISEHGECEADYQEFIEMESSI